MSDTPIDDRIARDLSEVIYSAYAQQAAGPIHPQKEQVLLARLAEALRPTVESGSEAEMVAAANAALSAWEQAEPEVKGPRLAGIDPRAATVTLLSPLR